MYARTRSGQLAWTGPIAAGRMAKSGWTLHSHSGDPAPANVSMPDNPSMPASSDLAVKVSSDHRPEFLTPGLEDGGIKQLGRPAIGRADVDLGLRTAGQEGDSEFRKLSQPQRRHLATVMQCYQPVSHRLVIDAELRPARSHAGEFGGEIGQEDQRAGVSGGVAG